MQTRPMVILAGAALLASCATVTQGTTETFVVETTPAGARASSTSGWQCTTPCRVEVPRRGDFVVTLHKEGYATKVVTVRSVPAAKPGLGGRVQVDTGWIGSVTDRVVGANNEHQPNPLRVVLDREL